MLWRLPDDEDDDGFRNLTEPEPRGRTSPCIDPSSEAAMTAWPLSIVDADLKF
jgi:hypothetical protein